MKKLITILLTLTLVFSLAACGGAKTEDLVKVGDVVINEKQLNEYVALVALISGQDVATIPEEGMAQIKSSMLENMIELELLNQHYADTKAKVLPRTVDADYKAFIDQANSEKDVSSYLKENDVSEETLKAFFYNQYYAEAYFEEAAKEIPALEDEMKAYYEENKEVYLADEVKASHILVGDKSLKPEDKVLAEEVLQKIKDGAKFEDMAKEHGTDGTKDSGGDLGWFGRGSMVKEFEDAAYALKVGELSGVVQSEFGFHLIKKTGERQYKPYEDVMQTIKQTMVDPIYSKNMEKLKKSTGIEYLSDKYAQEKKATDGAVKDKAEGTGGGGAKTTAGAADTTGDAIE